MSILASFLSSTLSSFFSSSLLLFFPSSLLLFFSSSLLVPSISSPSPLPLPQPLTLDNTHPPPLPFSTILQLSSTRKQYQDTTTHKINIHYHRQPIATSNQHQKDRTSRTIGKKNSGPRKDYMCSCCWPREREDPTPCRCSLSQTR
ncbi:hypothetical protein BKA57DRAFT_472247 [Linnemannia elongata]|nr:hypothetical protein BKA57DRAFT_472247 [Linnemannia elongata]